MQLKRFEVDGGSDVCIRCSYYSSKRICTVDNFVVPNPINLTCDAYEYYKNESIQINIDKKTGEYLVTDSFNDSIIYRYPDRQQALQEELKKKLAKINRATIKENKIYIRGEVLPLSEYELIANEVSKES